MVTQTRQKSYSVDQRDSKEARVQSKSGGSSSGKFSSLSSISNREDTDMDGMMLSEENDNDDRMSVESSVFEDTPPYTAPMMTRQQMSCDFLYDENASSALLTKKMLSSSNRSSSDSNKSQITIDTGYMSSATSAAERMTSGCGGGSSGGGGGTGNGTFRSRFSSEDTQSSLDSFMSSTEPLQQQQQTQTYTQPRYTDYSSSFGTANPSPSYLQTGGTSSYYLAAGTNDVIEYLQKYSARNYPNNLRTPPVTNNRQRSPSQPPQQQHVHKSSQQTQISASSSSIPADATAAESRGVSSAKAAASTGVSSTGGGDLGGVSNSTSATNSMSSLSPSQVGSTHSGSNKQQPASLLKLAPVHTHSHSGSQQSSSSSSASVSQSGSSSSRGGLASIAMPLRSQVSFDSAKILQTGQILGAKITQHFTGSRHNHSQQQQQQVKDKGAVSGQVPVTVNPPRRGLNGILNKPPPLTQIHHTKINQRQDSNISSDSFSITSSPGYNSKSMEAPLLQHTSKIHRSVGAMKHQDSSDSFNMTMRTGGGPGGSVSASGNRKFNVRQDSTISSDSFSQTSSPGYNSKLMEAPLLAHAAKMHKSKWERTFERTGDLNNLLHSVKQGFNERLPRSPLSTEHHPTSPIIKSASTPASLQTIVRFQNGSNMSLQHKVSGHWDKIYQETLFKVPKGIIPGADTAINIFGILIC